MLISDSAWPTDCSRRWKPFSAQHNRESFSCTPIFAVSSSVLEGTLVLTGATPCVYVAQAILARDLKLVSEYLPSN